MADEKKEIIVEAKKKTVGVIGEFKKFITRGNVLDMAVGVIMGNAFGAIVTAMVNILLSLATWGVPGGLKGLITVLPAVSDAQAGAAFNIAGETVNLQTYIAGETVNLQTFTTGEVNEMVVAYAAAQGKTLNVSDADFIQWKTNLLSLYDLHGTTYAYKMSAVIDWGAFINAIISFLVIALVLFVIMKVAAGVAAKRAELKAKSLEAYYQKHPEERPVPPEPGEPEPTELDLLKEIRDALVEKKEAEK